MDTTTEPNDSAHTARALQRLARRGSVRCASLSPLRAAKTQLSLEGYRDLPVVALVGPPAHP